MLYVDDVLNAVENTNEVDKLKYLLNKKFDMKDLGLTLKILGMDINRDRNTKKLCGSKKNYLNKMFERFSMFDAKSVGKPLINNFKLSSIYCPKNEENLQRYQMCLMLVQWDV